jgi:hypothetical protein
VRPYRLTRTPPALQRARLDNLALLPASFLSYKEQWQQIANGLPNGSVLIILPETAHKLRKPIEAVATHLKTSGYQVTTISASLFAEV